MELLTQHLGKGMFLILMLSLPAVLTAASVGLLVGIIQAVTQVQEQTISAAPKIILVFLLIIFGGQIMMTLLSNFVRESALIAFQEIPMTGNKLLPPRAKTAKQKRIETFYAEQVGLSRSGKDNQRIMKAPSMGIKGGQELRKEQIQSEYSATPKASVSEEMHLYQQEN